MVTCACFVAMHYFLRTSVSLTLSVAINTLSYFMQSKSCNTATIILEASKSPYTATLKHLGDAKKRNERMKI